MTTRRRLFVAGATGFLGRALAAQDPEEHGVDLVLQARPGSRGRKHLEGDERLREVDLEDRDALEGALRECDAVIQLIGSRKKRFDEIGDYEAVDYGTTATLVGAARRTGIDHFVMVSSVGAGRPVGAYLKWKKKAEDVVRDSGIAATVTRPGWLGGDKEFPDRAGFEGAGAFLRGFSDTPLSGWALDLRPMNVQLVAKVHLRIVRDREPLGVVKGRGLWRIAKEHDLYPWVR